MHPSRSSVADTLSQATFTQIYASASLARLKLENEADQPEHNLRKLVGHANFLDGDVDSLNGSMCCNLLPPALLEHIEVKDETSDIDRIKTGYRVRARDSQHQLRHIERVSDDDDDDDEWLSDDSEDGNQTDSDDDDENLFLARSLSRISLAVQQPQGSKASTDDMVPTSTEVLKAAVAVVTSAPRVVIQEITDQPKDTGKLDDTKLDTALVAV